jgi:hypothetical protein
LYLCWRRPILGENQGSFEGIKETTQNGERTKNRGKPTPRKIIYNVDKLLRSSWKVDKCRLGEWLVCGPTDIDSVGKWTDLIHLGLGYLSHFLYKYNVLGLWK